MTRSAQRPESDVSAAVGLVGLAGLVAWIAVCRNWAAIADAFGLAGPRAPLDGPNAALTALLFSGVPMVLWSVVVNKVHRNPSTGIDWRSPRPLHDAMPVSAVKIAGLWATFALVAFVYGLGRWYWRGQFLFAMIALGAVLPLLIGGTVVYVLWLDRVLVNPRDGAWHFGAMLLRRKGSDPVAVREYLRAWAVKGFFIAFMLSILPDGFNAVVRTDFGRLVRDPAGLTNALTTTLFMIDVQIAMVGYILTFRPLDAQIRSANPLLGGWVAALVCYPPFVLMGNGGVLDYHKNAAEWSVWLAGQGALLWLWTGLLVALTAIYAWATVAFGLRFSNLTHRGVITGGPYAFTRHPAYLAKNLYWWLLTLPFLATTGSPVDMVRNTTILGLVSAVYFWRARTEEAHLLSVDAKYREYHAWMAENGLVTAPLEKLARWASRRFGAGSPQLGNRISEG